MTNQQRLNQAFNNSDNVEYPADCVRIQSIAKNVFNVDITLKEAEKIWSLNSESMAAGWLCLPDDDMEIVQTINFFVYKRTGQWLDDNL